MISGPAPTNGQIALALLQGKPDSLKQAESPYGKATEFGKADATAEEKWQAAKRLGELEKEAKARGVDLDDPAAKQVLKNYDDLQAYAKLSPDEQLELERAGVSMDKLVMAFKASLKTYIKSKEKEEGDSFNVDRDPLMRMMKEEIKGLRLAEDEENRDRMVEALKETGKAEEGKEGESLLDFKPEEVAKTIEEAFREVLDRARRDKDGGPRDSLDLSPEARAMLGLDKKDDENDAATS